MSNRRYTIQTTANQIFYQMPKVFFTSRLYKNMSNDAKIMYMLMSDRLKLSIENGWTNENNEVYFVYPVLKLCEITNLSKNTILKVKKELTEYNLLQEEKTGRANRLYLLQIEATDNDLYEIRKQDLDLDENADKIERNEKGQITRSPKNELQAKTRSSKFGLQAEKASNGDSLQSNQKSKLCTSEVQNLGTNKNNNKQTEEEEYHISNPIFKILKESKLFSIQEISQIMIQLDECVNEEMVKEQLDVMAMQTRLLSPTKYFLNGIRKTIDFYEFKISKSERERVKA